LGDLTGDSIRGFARQTSRDWKVAAGRRFW
jgi:hypothetical protein